MILETEVHVKINQYNFQYYQHLGYNFTKYGEIIIVKVEDLPKTSGIKVHTICEYCGNVIIKPFRRYIESIEKGKNCCNICKKHKVVENTIKKYGVKTTLQIPYVHEKIVKNNIEKYGVKLPLESQVIRNKAKETMKNKYGCEYTLQNPDLLYKVHSTLYSNGGGIPTSKQQKYICDLYSGKLNYPIGKFFIDIFFDNENICCEYDGGGHSLAIEYGESAEVFNNKEEKRVEYLISNGYKIFKIVSKKDVLPSDLILLKIKEKAFDILRDFDFYTINIDTFEESFK